MPITHLPDAAVDAALDRELRDLLTLCFTKPQDVVFRDRRYFREPPAHRWLCRDAAGRLIAHAAVHDKRVEAGGSAIRIGGIAEVCVHPDARGQGLVHVLLRAIHAWLVERGVAFAVLFGNPKVYASSGYLPVANVRVRAADGGAWEPGVGAMARPLGQVPWPAGEVNLVGPRF